MTSNESQDWWLRIGSAAGLLSGIAYAMAMAVLSEFTRPLGLNASDLGLGIREYVAVSLVMLVSFATFSGLSVLVVAVMVGLIDSVGPDRTNTDDGASTEDEQPDVLVWMLVGAPVFLGVAFTLAMLSVYVVTFRLPSPDLFDASRNGPSTDSKFLWPVLLECVVTMFAVLIVGGDRTAAAEASPSGGEGDSDRWNLVKLRVANLLKERLVATILVLTIVITTTVTGSMAASEYAEGLLAGNHRTAPLLLRFVINPSPTCAYWDSDTTYPGPRPEGEVTRLAQSGGREVLISDGNAWLLNSDDIVLASNCE